MPAEEAETTIQAPHSALSVAEVGWSGITNGRLLSLAAPKFDVFLTSDTNLEFQQNLGDLSLIIVVLFAPSNDITVLVPLIPAVIDALAANNLPNAHIQRARSKLSTRPGASISHRATMTHHFNVAGAWPRR